ncbi:hypothetical protein NQ318_001840 [Aromia moschata]|uniref:Uncharacterized protein n=1 Tax=Aromia moschata TaxID=1265417 RepID=A0AAV8Z307_9CUCU|nr:hypothetical protein NQ318_001840 [Aromia moschata]
MSSRNGLCVDGKSEVKSNEPLSNAGNISENDSMKIGQEEVLIKNEDDIICSRSKNDKTMQCVSEEQELHKSEHSVSIQHGKQDLPSYVLVHTNPRDNKKYKHSFKTDISSCFSKDNLSKERYQCKLCGYKTP